MAELIDLGPDEKVLPFAGTIKEPPKLHDLEPGMSVVQQKGLVNFGVESGSEAMKLGHESLAAGKRNKELKESELKNILGDKYAAGDFEADQGFLAQADIARSMTLTDKQRKWRDLYYPNGDLISVPTTGGPVLMGRESKNKPYREIGLGETVAGAALSEPTALGLAGSFAGLPGTFAGTMAGSVLQSEVEKARGYGEGQPGLGGSLREAAIATGIDSVFRGFGRLARGRYKSRSEVESITEATQAVEELGLEPIAIGQIGGPLERGTFRQIGMTAPRIEQKITKQQESLLESFRNMGEELPEQATDDILLDVVKAQQNELKSIINFKFLSRLDAGEALQKGIDTWKKSSRRLRDRYYNKAHELADDIVYVLTPAKKVSESIERGVKGWTTEGGVIKISATPKGELKEIVDTLNSLEDNVSKLTVRDVRAQPGPAQLGEGPVVEEWTAFEQIKTLRTRLFDLKNSSEGDVRREATRLWKALTEVMDSPISGNPEFVAAHKKARAFNRLREDTLEKSYVAQSLRTDTPEMLARKYMNPNNITGILSIRDLLPRKHWNEFRQAFQIDLINSYTPKQALARLDKFKVQAAEVLEPSKKGTKGLLDPVEERDLRKFLRRKHEFDTSNAAKIMEQQLAEGEKFVTLAQKSTAGEIGDAVRLSGGKNSNYAQIAKAGIYKDILDNSTSMTQLGQDVIDITKLLNNISKWRKTGKLDELFTEADWRRIRLYEKYASSIQSTADVGGGFMAGSLRQKIIQAPSQIAEPGMPKKILKTIVRPLVSNSITAWLLTRPAAVARMHYKKGASLPLNNLATAMGITAVQYEKSKPKQIPIPQPEVTDPVYHTGGLVVNPGFLKY